MKQVALLLMVVLFTMSGCKKEETVVPDYTSTFVGTWRATKLTQNGQVINLVGNTDIALYFKATSTGTNKISCVVSTVVQAKVTDSDSFELLISKSGDNYTLTETTKDTSGGTTTYQYTTSIGELKIFAIDSKGQSAEFIFKK